MLTLAIPESSRPSIPKVEENLKIWVHLNKTIFGPYTLGFFDMYTSILFSNFNSKILALAKYLW